MAFSILGLRGGVLLMLSEEVKLELGGTRRHDDDGVS